MENTFADYILNRRVGLAEIGLTRQEIARRLGGPVDWVGKPPVIGFAILNPDDSQNWIYYGGGCGVHFDGTNHVDSLLIYPEHVDNGKYPFKGWPVRAGYTMGDFRKYLIEQGIPFEEKWNGKDTACSIIAAGHCCCRGNRYGRGGRVLFPDEQDMIFIENGPV